MTSPIVTQADRDLFSFARGLGADDQLARIASGDYDDDALMQRIARHRTAHSGEGRSNGAGEDAVERAALAIQAKYQEAHHTTFLPIEVCRDYARAALATLTAPPTSEDRLRSALEPFAEAWDVATHHKELVSKLTMAQLGELAAHEVSGVHFRNARAALSNEGAGK